MLDDPDAETNRDVSEQQDGSGDDAVKIGGRVIVPAEGEQEKSHEREETLSPDEKSGGDDRLEPRPLPDPE